jgi:hypothetical protein
VHVPEETHGQGFQCGNDDKKLVLFALTKQPGDARQPYRRTGVS